jgi:hypothetical protein
MFLRLFAPFNNNNALVTNLQTVILNVPTGAQLRDCVTVDAIQALVLHHSAHAEVWCCVFSYRRKCVNTFIRPLGHWNFNDAELVFGVKTAGLSVSKCQMETLFQLEAINHLSVLKWLTTLVRFSVCQKLSQSPMRWRFTHALWAEKNHRTILFVYWPVTPQTYWSKVEEWRTLVRMAGLMLVCMVSRDLYARSYSRVTIFQIWLPR